MNNGDLYHIHNSNCVSRPQSQMTQNGTKNDRTQFFQMAQKGTDPK